MPRKNLKTHREKRRRARWSAFWTPFITLASIVISVGVLMFFARTCRERFPQLSPPWDGCAAQKPAGERRRDAKTPGRRGSKSQESGSDPVNSPGRRVVAGVAPRKTSL
ncbi:MAG: hypothetical protein Q8S00_14270 [Deltaproteobacteria bacterium]|nr:hypothetical protein [Deltaproteobacteria bacterium]